MIVNELPYNLLCRAIEFDTMPFCAKQGIGIIGYMTLLQGILAGIYTSLSDVPVWQRRTRHFNSMDAILCRHGEKGFERETEEALTAIKGLALKNGMTMHQLSIKWAITNSDITCALVGARNAKELEENVKAVSEKSDPSIIYELNKITEALKYAMGNHFDYYESKENDRTV